MSRFRTRRMEAGDDRGFNDTFNALVAGILPPRPLEVMRRIWRGGPGGPVVSWIVEAETGDGEWRLIAHHGLCPVRYTMEREEFVFAKTVNSFLLPEYRGKFLYLRFEQRCLAQAERMFDATYSVNPPAARLRAPLGYDSHATAITFERGLQPPAILSRLLARLSWRLPAVPLQHLARVMAAFRAPPAGLSSLSLMEFAPPGAGEAGFFSDFWDESRLQAGLAPRRDATDLAWRFWDTPDRQRTTLTCTWPGGVRGYCIIDHTGPWKFHLEDIFLSAPLPDRLQQFLDAIFHWCARRGALMLTFMTTMDGQPPELLSVFRRNMGSNLSLRYPDGPISRRLTPRGRKHIGALWPPCNVTPIIAPA